MNRAELIKCLSEKTNLTKKDLEKAVEAFCGSVTEALAAGEKVRLVGFGTFATKNRAARKVYNPTNKAKTKIKARRIPIFKAGKNLKDLAGR
ncbi:HU family DNA-binding protein [Pelotomaculum propionicicum]|uniref:HU family DNA-binding protein n=1 Tax=Pelotomaculum propionicicum TaxID=258475 RepID=UPI003B7CDA81